MKRVNGRPRIFVTHLTRDVDEHALYEFFSRWCSVTQAWIVRESDGRSKNYGFVEGESHEDARRALELDGYAWNGRQIVVAPANGPSL